MTKSKILLIGYGNTLRSDDGIGYQVAEAVAAQALPQVKALAVHQLTPELAAEIAQFNLVIFIDAAVVATSEPEIQVERLLLDGTASFTTHIATPAALLALAQSLYQATPIAYQIKIPAVHFAIGETLSAIALRGKIITLDYLQGVLSEGILTSCTLFINT